MKYLKIILFLPFLVMGADLDALINEERSECARLVVLVRTTTERPSALEPLMSEEYAVRSTLHEEWAQELEQIQAYQNVNASLIKTREDFVRFFIKHRDTERADYRRLQEKFTEDASAITERVAAIPTKKVKFADGTILTIRESVVEQIPYLLSAFDSQYMGEAYESGALVLLNPEYLVPILFRQLIAYLTEKDSGVTLNSPTQLFVQRCEYNNTNRRFLVLNAPMIFLIYYLGKDPLPMIEEDPKNWDWNYGAAHVIDNISVLRKLAVLPAEILVKSEFHINVQAADLIYASDFEPLLRMFYKSATPAKVSLVAHVALLVKKTRENRYSYSYGAETYYEREVRLLTSKSDKNNLLALRALPKCIRDILEGTAYGADAA